MNNEAAAVPGGEERLRLSPVFVLMMMKPAPARLPLQPRQNPVDWILGSAGPASLPARMQTKTLLNLFGLVKVVEIQVSLSHC